MLLLDFDENIIIDKHHTPHEYKHLVGNADYRWIEPDIRDTIWTLKTSVDKNKNNVTILGLTKRWAKHATHYDHGHKHAEDAGLAFSRLRFKDLDGTKLCNNEHSSFFNGVIYTAGQDKGTYLEDFLNKSGFQPSRIVFSDDKEDNLKSVIDFAKRKNISIDAYQMNGAKNLK